MTSLETTNRPQKKTPGAAAPKATAESTKPAKPISISELGKLPKTDTAVPKLVAAIAQHGSAKVLAELVKSDWMQRAIVAGARKLVDLLLTHGIDADARSSDVVTVSRSPGPLSALMLSDKWSTAEICELVPRLLAAGASPDRLHPDLRICNPERINECYSALDHAYRRGKPEIVELLLPAVKEQVTLVSTTVMALLDVRPARNWTAEELAPKAASLQQWIVAGKLPRTGVSRWGLPVAHAALLSANEGLFALLVPDAAAACTTLPAKVELIGFGPLHDHGLPTNSTLNLPAGSAPIDLAMRLIPVLRDEYARSAHPDSSVPTRIAAMETMIERLTALGARAADLTVEVPAEVRVVYDEFCRWVGREAVDRAWGTLKITGPWLTAFRLAKAIGIPTLEPILGPHADEDAVAFLLLQRSDAWPIDPQEARDIVKDGGSLRGHRVIDVNDYPKPVRAIIRGGRLRAMRGDTLLCLSETNDGALWELRTDDSSRCLGTAAEAFERLRGL